MFCQSSDKESWDQIKRLESTLQNKIKDTLKVKDEEHEEQDEHDEQVEFQTSLSFWLS